MSLAPRRLGHSGRLLELADNVEVEVGRSRVAINGCGSALDRDSDMLYQPLAEDLCATMPRSCPSQRINTFAIG